MTAQQPQASSSAKNSTKSSTHSILSLFSQNATANLRMLTGISLTTMPSASESSTSNSSSSASASASSSQATIIKKTDVKFPPTAMIQVLISGAKLKIFIANDKEKDMKDWCQSLESAKIEKINIPRGYNSFGGDAIRCYDYCSNYESKQVENSAYRNGIFLMWFFGSAVGAGKGEKKEEAKEEIIKNSVNSILNTIGSFCTNVTPAPDDLPTLTISKLRPREYKCIFDYDPDNKITSEQVLKIISCFLSNTFAANNKLFASWSDKIGYLNNYHLPVKSVDSNVYQFSSSKTATSGHNQASGSLGLHSLNFTSYCSTGLNSNSTKSVAISLQPFRRS